MFGSQGARASPNLIAACHVLHRLSMPRHPSEALIRLIVLSKTHAWGQKMPPGRTKDRLAPTHALQFVFADNDVFSDPSWKLAFPLGGGGEPDRPFNSRCQIAAAGMAGTETCIFRDRWRAALKRAVMVESDGIEPTTSCLQSTRSTN